MAKTLIPTLACDVLVVGGGPAGSSAALAAREGGAKTILIEKREVIGSPVRCGEAVGEYLLDRVPKMPEHVFTNALEGMRFVIDGHVEERRGGIWTSRAVDRLKFDLHLARSAFDAGVEVKTDTILESFEFKEEKVAAAIINEHGIRKRIAPKVVIAADGGESTVRALILKEPWAVSAGIREARPDEFAETYSVKLAVARKLPPFDYVFIGKDYAPEGYGYVFVTSDCTANVGVGTANADRPMKEYFERFIASREVKELLGEFTAVEVREKKIPFSESWAPVHASNVVFCGDAANLILKPLMEGILPAAISGTVAGKCAAANVTRGQPLEPYTEQLKEALPELEFSDAVMGIMRQAFKRDGKDREKILYSLILRCGDVTPESALRDLDAMAGVAGMTSAGLAKEVARMSTTPANDGKEKEKRKNA